MKFVLAPKKGQLLMIPLVVFAGFLVVTWGMMMVETFDADSTAPEIAPVAEGETQGDDAEIPDAEAGSTLVEVLFPKKKHQDAIGDFIAIFDYVDAMPENVGLRVTAGSDTFEMVSPEEQRGKLQLQLQRDLSRPGKPELHFRFGGEVLEETENGTEPYFATVEKLLLDGKVVADFECDCPCERIPLSDENEAGDAESYDALVGCSFPLPTGDFKTATIEIAYNWDAPEKLDAASEFVAWSPGDYGEPNGIEGRFVVEVSGREEFIAFTELHHSATDPVPRLVQRLDFGLSPKDSGKWKVLFEIEGMATSSRIWALTGQESETLREPEQDEAPVAEGEPRQEGPREQATSVTVIDGTKSGPGAG